MFNAVSSPSNPLYGKHLSKEAIKQLVQAEEDVLKKVMQWVVSVIPEEHVQVSEFEDAIVLHEAPLSAVEALLECKFASYVHHRTGHVVTRALSYSVPADLQGMVSFVEGVINFPNSRPIKSEGYLNDAAGPVKAKSDFPGTPVSPQTLFHRYKLEQVTGSKGNIAIAEFSGDLFGQYYSPDDLSAFQSKYMLPQQKVQEVVGKNDGKKPTGEAELDVQYAMAVARGVPMIFWSHNGTYYEWITQVLQRESTPLVWSVSYNLGDENDYSAENRAAMDAAFQKLALRGVSLLFASGDEGTGKTGMIFCGKFNPGYPAASPYVTR
jgi:tripeptidyl-peptidase-1